MQRTDRGFLAVRFRQPLALPIGNTLIASRGFVKNQTPTQGVIA